MGLSFAISFPAGRDLFAFTRSRTFSRKAATFFFAGLIKSLCRLPVLYLRTCWPRKSNPSSICVMSVFSGERVRPRSRKNVSTAGLTSCSSSSFELPESRVAKGHCCPSAPSEPDLSLSRHPAQAHHEQHGSLFSSCLDCWCMRFSSVSRSRSLYCWQSRMLRSVTA